MYRFIVMHCGYVESSMTSALIYQTEFFGHPGYETMKEAITELALDMYAKYYSDCLSVYEHRYSRLDDCCRKKIIEDNDAKFCCQCGKTIADKKFDYDEFKEYITQLHCSTCDSYGDAEWSNNRDLAWWPYWTEKFLGAPREDIIFIGENAEVILLAALLEAKPELEDPDQDITYSINDWEEFKNGKDTRE